MISEKRARSNKMRNIRSVFDVDSFQLLRPTYADDNNGGLTNQSMAVEVVSSNEQGFYENI